MSKNHLHYIKQARKIQKEKATLPFLPDEEKPLKLAILGDMSLQHIAQVLFSMLWEQDIPSEIYQGEYDGVLLDVLDQDSAYYHFEPDITILLLHSEHIKARPTLLASHEEMADLLQETARYYQSLWTAIQSHSHSHILQSNFVLPLEDPLGNLSVNYLFSQTSFLQGLNLKLRELRPNFVNFVDLEGLSNEIGKRQWFSPCGYHMNKVPFHLEHLVPIGDLFVKQMQALQGKSKKCLVLDLDNTLWGGEVGDLGVAGIELNPNHPIGESFLAFQQYVLSLKERGVILAVCSKNQEAMAKKPFLEHEMMLLTLEDISVFVANWEDKASNLRKIAQTLNISLDSLVFFDDNPAERHIVSEFLPEVTVIEVPEDTADFVYALDVAHAFEGLQVTKEDLERGATYQTRQKLQQVETQFVNYEDYLQSLEMFCHIFFIQGEDVARFSQLINKSNQYNLRTQRYTEGEILSFLEESAYRLIGLTLEDKFSHYGMIACVILKKIENYCFIDTYLMSCRVLKRGIEDVLLPSLCQIAQEMGCDTLLGEYIPSAKNEMVADFYEKLQFRPCSAKDCSALGVSPLSYVLEIERFVENKYFIQRKEGSL